MNGEDPTIPTPSWKYEEYLVAIIGKLGEMSAASQPLFVTLTYDDVEDEYSVDKTFAEITEAIQSGRQVYLQDRGYQDGFIYTLDWFHTDVMQFGFFDNDSHTYYSCLVNNDNTVEIAQSHYV